MAFTTSNVRVSQVGDLKIIAGDWAGSSADANGTMFAQSGRSYMDWFGLFDSTSGPVQAIETSVGANVGTATTINVQNRNQVTNGRFLIIRA